MDNMRQIIIGTKNQAKFAQMRDALRPLGLEAVMPEDLPEVIEDGETNQINARKKALTYARFLNDAVLSMDNALYFPDLPADEQPGQNVRRIKGRIDRPSDNEILEYYRDLIDRYGGEIKGRWEYAICLARPDGQYWETTVNSERTFVSRQSDSIMAGYPLESLQIDPKSGRPLASLPEEDRRRLMSQRISGPLQEFIKATWLAEPEI
ncbi:MAG: non-canonical purine NTP pyrophosphatase [Patescibacteria group bacterium]